MKRALVLGATGGMGWAIVQELHGRGIEVVAFARDKNKLNQKFSNVDNVNIFPGNAFSKSDLLSASKDVDVIFNAVNLPYANWSTELLKLIKGILEIVEKRAAKLVVVDNIYAYGSSPGNKVSETHNKQPCSKKGLLRLQMEQEIRNANVSYMIAHFPDFYGPHAENTLLNHTLRSIAMNKHATFIGNNQVKREYIYTPDGAKILVELAMKKGSYNEIYNIPATDVISGIDIVRIIREETGYRKKVFIAKKGTLRVLGLFDSQIRELLELQYLNENPVILDGEKIHTLMPNMTRTSYRSGIVSTINYYQSK